MSHLHYTINKGVGKAIEFKGLKAQYIIWLAVGLLGMLLLFAILYLCGINTYIIIPIVFTIGTGYVMHVYKLSNRYGEHGMTKAVARKSIPKVIKCFSRQVFLRLNK